jgi:hypothetical protein
MPPQRAARSLINPITNAEVCNVKEAQHLFQAAEAYYNAHKQPECRALAKVCTGAIYALQRARYDGPEVLKQMMTEWLEKLEGEEKKAEKVVGEGQNEELDKGWEEV